MSLLEAVLLGVLQGVTEFLPISSSGHLAIASHLIDLQKEDILYETLLHFATMLAIIIYFRRRITLIIKAFLGIFFKRYSMIYFENKRYLWGIILASIPTGIIGLSLQNTVIGVFQSTTIIGYALILTSVILYISDKFNPSGKLTTKSAIVIGIIQGLAVFPGISRSGSTIATAVMLNVNRKEAAEFSMLISLPAILGATILQLKDIDPSSLIDLNFYLLGMGAAFITALFAISFMLYVVRTAKLTYFAVYCLLAGIATIIFL